MHRLPMSISSHTHHLSFLLPLTSTNAAASRWVGEGWLTLFLLLPCPWPLSTPSSFSLSFSLIYSFPNLSPSLFPLLFPPSFLPSVSYPKQLKVKHVSTATRWWVSLLGHAPLYRGAEPVKPHDPDGLLKMTFDLAKYFTLERQKELLHS